jgi:hypothetical protein
VTEPTPDREALDTAKGLTEQVKGLREEVKGLRTYGRRSRWYIFIDVALTIVLAVVTVVAIHASQDATTARSSAASAKTAAAAEHSSLLASCVLGNQTRAQEIQLWTHLAQVASPAPHLTRAQIAQNRKKVAALLAYIRTVFAPRPCQKLYRLP